jgi:hypothetical protein
MNMGIGNLGRIGLGAIYFLKFVHRTLTKIKNSL